MSNYPDYKRITPEEVFIDLPLEEWQTVDDLKYLIETRPTGIEFLDVFFETIKRRKKIRAIQIAKIMQINELTLRHTVFALTGIFVHDWVTQYVFLVCCKLLKYTDYSIIEVAKRAGFTSASAFTQFFMRMQKLAPIDWRAAHKVR